MNGLMAAGASDSTEIFTTAGETCFKSGASVATPLSSSTTSAGVIGVENAS